MAFLWAAPAGQILPTKFVQAQQQVLLGENPFGIPTDDLLTIPVEANSKRITPFGPAVDSNRPDRSNPTVVMKV